MIVTIENAADLAIAAIVAAREIHDAAKKEAAASETATHYLTAACACADMALRYAYDAQRTTRHIAERHADKAGLLGIFEFGRASALAAVAAGRAMLELHKSANAFPSSLIELAFLYEWQEGDDIDAIADALLAYETIEVTSAHAPGGPNHFYNVYCRPTLGKSIAEIDAELTAIIAGLRTPERVGEAR